MCVVNILQIFAMTLVDKMVQTMVINFERINFVNFDHFSPNNRLLNKSTSNLYIDVYFTPVEERSYVI